MKCKPGINCMRQFYFRIRSVMQVHSSIYLNINRIDDEGGHRIRHFSVAGGEDSRCPKLV